MTARVIDFDAFLKEQKEKAGEEVDHPAMVIGGKTYMLPTDLPASIAINVMQMQKREGKEANVPPETLHQIGVSLFGEEAFPEILVRTQMGVKQMGELIMQAFRLYDPNDGKDAVPNRKARRATRSTSSKTGR